MSNTLGSDLVLDPRKRIKSHSISGLPMETGPDNQTRPHQQMAQLTLEEKKFLLAVERGDVAATKRMLENATESGTFNINCADPLGRSALLMAIDNENLEMVETLLEYRVETKDALLHAISEEYVEAVEVLLEHEDQVHKPGEPHSWEALPPDTATFTSDITPLILAAHRDNYEIIKLLLDRGSTLPMPHDIRCGCDECVNSRQEDSLRHSRSRINSYRALASPSLIALSSKGRLIILGADDGMSLGLRVWGSGSIQTHGVWTAARFAAEGLASGLRAQLKPHGIPVISLHPDNYYAQKLNEFPRPSIVYEVRNDCSDATKGESAVTSEPVIEILSPYAMKSVEEAILSSKIKSTYVLSPSASSRVKNVMYALSPNCVSSAILKQHKTIEAI